MQLPPLILGVKNSIWRVHDANREDADAAFRSVRYQVTQRDKLTCVYCGMKTRGVEGSKTGAPDGTARTSGYMEVHHLDDDHTNNVPDNLVTVCPFCHAVFHCGNAGHRQAGHIIHAPWIMQADLNLVCHMMFILMYSATQAGRDQEYKNLAQDITGQYNALEELRGDACEIFGEGMDDPSNFGYALKMLSSEDNERYKQRHTFLGGARFLPSYSAHETQIRIWFLSNASLVGRGIYQEIYKSWRRRCEEWMPLQK